MFIYILLINVIGFGTMWYDKIMARTGKYKYRVAESRIFLIALAGGAIGIFIGMETKIYSFYTSYYYCATNLNQKFLQIKF